MSSSVAVTAELAEFVATLSPDAIPSSARQHVPRALLDLVGVTVAGSSEPTARLIRAYAMSQGAKGPAALLGGGVRLAPSFAALVNGTAGHALDFDDIGVRAGHVSVAMMPAALAVAELAQASGRQFVDAMVIGYEIANRFTRLYDDSIDSRAVLGRD